MTHRPVLLQEVLAGLAPEPGEIFLDATINRGGHARAIAERLGPRGRLIGLDRDREALAEAAVTLATGPSSVKLVESNFADLATVLDQLGGPRIDLALFDLGFSSEQMDESRRGFSFRRDEPLYMTFGAPAALAPGALTAAAIVNTWPEAALVKIFREYGEEKFAGPIARAIVAARGREHLVGTGQLVKVIESAVPAGYRHRRLHFATKTFQALRIAVNDELGSLERALPAVWSRLALGGRLGVISFHSLEARLVKNFFRNLVKEGQGELVTPRAVKPSPAEVKRNPRARSAQLRIIKKI